MTTKTINPERFVESIHALLERFRDELTGARQATRTQLVQFLARELGLTEDTAGRLFDELRKAGVIVRGDEPVDRVDIPERDGQQWSIETDSAGDAVPQLDPQLAAPAPIEHERQAVELMRRAIAHRATDIHLDPFDDEVEVRFRIDGQLEHYCRLSEEVGDQITAQLKVLANLDPAEHFQPREGRLELPVALSDYGARITVTPVVGGQAVSVRMLRREQILRPLDTLGLSRESLAKVVDLLRFDDGMILVCGPCGAGKTTTLYSLVHHLDDGRRNVVTVEDPVEYLVPGFLQVQVDVRHGLSFATGLRTALRMDPDVLLLGEIRDAETAAAAIRAASSGKFLLGTFHARDAACAVTGMRSMHVEDRSLADNLRAVIAQRLVRRVCEKCRGRRSVDVHDAARFAAERLTPPEHVPDATDCDRCLGTGLHERIGIFEIAVITPEVADAVASGKGERDLRQLLRSGGVPSLASDGLAKVRDGITTSEEVASMSGLSQALAPDD